MRSAHKWISMLLAVCLTLGLAAIPAQAQSGTGNVTAVLQGNTGAILTSEEAILSVTADEALVCVSILDNTALVTALTDEAVMVPVMVETASGTTLLEIPLGYTTFSFSGDTLTVYEGADDKYEVAGINAADEEYLEGDASYPLPVEYDSDGNAVYQNSDSYSINVAIKKKGGSYVFYGQSDDMSISVKKEATGAATLILAGLDLTSSFTAPITVKKDSTTTVEIRNPAGFSNTLSDQELNNEDLHGGEGSVDTSNPEYAESAVIKGKSGAQITISGSGALTLNCNSKNAVKVSEYGSLTVKDVHLTAVSCDHGISSDNTLEIRSGTIHITCEGDGIRSDPDTVDPEAGASAEILISGGSFSILAGSDGIQVNELLTITGGDFDIRTGLGYQDSTFDPDSQSCKGLKVSVNTDESDDTSESTCTLNVSGGTFNLNCADDAVHSDGYIVMTGGSFQIRTGDDGVHADTSLTVGTEGASLRQPEIAVLSSYEGLEAGNIYIYDGNISVTASDDGINAAGGSDSSDTNVGFNPGRPGWPGEGGASAADYSINVCGGKIFINASADGFDSNGTLNLLGGETVVWGASSGDGEPLDHDGTMTIDGATVLALGRNSMSSTSTNSAQKLLSSQIGAQTGKTINVVHNGAIVFNTRAVKSCSYMMFSSPDLTATSGWSFVVDDSPLLEEECEHSSRNTVTENETKPGCETAGSYDQVTYCLDCGEELSRSTVSVGPTGHTPGDVVIENETKSGCETAGSYDQVTYCLDCGEELSRSTVSVAPTGHTPGDVVTENETKPGCETAGSYDQVTYCLDCGEELSRSTVTADPTGHCFGEWIQEEAPGYRREGSEVRTCSVCGFAEQRSVPKLPNPFTDVCEGSWYYDPVLWAVDNGITNGLTETTFGPGEVCNRAQVVTFLWRAAGQPEPTATEKPFLDVKETDFYYKAVLWAVENGITNGVDATHFGPSQSCNRAQVVTFLYRTLESPAVTTTECPFTDVEHGQWYEQAVLWAVENGVTNGMSADTFGVNIVCNRAQVVTFLYRIYAN